MAKYVVSDDVFYQSGLNACGFHPLAMDELCDDDKWRKIRGGDIVIVNVNNLEQLKKRSIF